MFRKLKILFALLVILNLWVSSAAAPMPEKPPRFEAVFDVETLSAESYIWGGVEVFKGELYMAVSTVSGGDLSGLPGASVYRSRDGKQWTQASPYGYGIDPRYLATWDLIPFKGRLYAGVNDWWSYGLPGLVMRTENGSDWSPSFEAPNGELQGGMVDKFGVFKGNLYMISNSPGMVWRSPSGDPGSWENVAQLGNIGSASPLVEFKDALYVSTRFWEGGVQLWRSFDGVAWEAVGESIHSDPLAENDCELAVFRNKLYFTVESWADGARIYRSADGVNWELVVQHGFEVPGADPGTYAIPVIANPVVYRGEIYVTSYDLSVEGVKVWKSRSGDAGSWVLVNDENLGEPYESWVWRGTQAVFKGDLYFGASDLLYRMTDFRRR